MYDCHQQHVVTILLTIITIIIMVISRTTSKRKAKTSKRYQNCISVRVVIVIIFITIMIITITILIIASIVIIYIIIFQYCLYVVQIASINEIINVFTEKPLTLTKTKTMELKLDQPPGPLVMAFKETITSSSSLDIVAEVEKQYVAITPPDSPVPPMSMVRIRALLGN